MKTEFPRSFNHAPRYTPPAINTIVDVLSRWRTIGTNPERHDVPCHPVSHMFSYVSVKRLRAEGVLRRSSADVSLKILLNLRNSPRRRTPASTGRPIVTDFSIFLRVRSARTRPGLLRPFFRSLSSIWTLRSAPQWVRGPRFNPFRLHETLVKRHHNSLSMSPS